jgi:hypothetical protein
MDEARTEQVLQEALGTWTQDAHLKDLDREIDQRWQTIERLAQELLCHHPCDLEEAGAQARVSLVLSNAGHWDEDHSLTALARILVASNGSKPSDPSLADALARIEDC